MGSVDQESNGGGFERREGEIRTFVFIRNCGVVESCFKFAWVVVLLSASVALFFVFFQKLDVAILEEISQGYSE